jgi:hypothetical protein
MAELSPNEIEVPLYLLSRLPTTLIPTGKLCLPESTTLVAQLVDLDCINVNSEIVKRMMFSNYQIYCVYFKSYPDKIPSILSQFMSVNGILSNYSRLASNSANIFLRFCSRLKAELTPYLSDLYTGLQNVISQAQGN